MTITLVELVPEGTLGVSKDPSCAAGNFDCLPAIGSWGSGRPYAALVDADARSSLTRLAVVACAGSVVWELAAGIAAIMLGTAAGSVALVAFGLDSLVNASASGVLVWRFGREGRSGADSGRVEHIAVRLVGAALVMSALYVTAQAIFALAGRSGPGHTAAGLVLAGASVLVLPVLARLKLRLARDLGSRALRGDGVLSAAGAGLAAATLLGLVVGGAFGWWWADSAAALVIVGALAREGRRALSAPS